MANLDAWKEVVVVIFRRGVDEPVFFGKLSPDKANKRVTGWQLRADPTEFCLVFEEARDDRMRTSADYRDGLLDGLLINPSAKSMQVHQGKSKKE